MKARKKVTGKAQCSELALLRQIGRRNLNTGNYFLVKDYQNQILIADDDKTKTVIIMLNMGVGRNCFEQDVPRLIHGYIMSGYHMDCVVYLTKGISSSTTTETRNFIYQDNIYVVDTYTIRFA